MLPYRRLVVKIGSNVLTQADGLPDMGRQAELVAQVAELRQQGVEVIVVSSGAVAAGRSLLSLPARTDAVRSRQVLAAGVALPVVLTTPASAARPARPARGPLDRGSRPVDGHADRQHRVAAADRGLRVHRVQRDPGPRRR